MLGRGVSSRSQGPRTSGRSPGSGSPHWSQGCPGRRGRAAARRGLAELQAGDADQHREQALDLAERSGRGPAGRAVRPHSAPHSPNKCSQTLARAAWRGDAPATPPWGEQDGALQHPGIGTAIPPSGAYWGDSTPRSERRRSASGASQARTPGVTIRASGAPYSVSGHCNVKGGLCRIGGSIPTAGDHNSPVSAGRHLNQDGDNRHHTRRQLNLGGDPYRKAHPTAGRHRHQRHPRSRGEVSGPSSAAIP